MPSRHPKLSKNDRRLLTTSWATLAEGNPSRVHVRLNGAWLRATEQAPTWVWGVIGVSEAVEGGPSQHPKFLQLVNQIVVFIGHGISMLQAGKDSRFAASCQQLGLRHRHYFLEGQRPAYWSVFCRELRDTIGQLVDEYCAEQASFSFGTSFDGGSGSSTHLHDNNNDASPPPPNNHNKTSSCSSSGRHESVPEITGHPGSRQSSNGSGTEDNPSPQQTMAPPPPHHKASSRSEKCLSQHQAVAAAAAVTRAKSAPRTSLTALTGSHRFHHLNKLPRHFRQQEKLARAWDVLLSILLDNIRLGYVGNCAKPGGSVGGSLMNILSMSGMMGNANNFGQLSNSSSVDKSSEDETKTGGAGGPAGSRGSIRHKPSGCASHHAVRRRRSQIKHAPPSRSASVEDNSIQPPHLTAAQQRLDNSAAVNNRLLKVEIAAAVGGGGGGGKPPKLGVTGRSKTEASYTGDTSGTEDGI